MNKLIKRVTALTLMVAMCALCTACGAKSKVPDSYNYDLTKYINLGNYEGLEYVKVDREVSDEDVQARIQEDLEFNSESIEINEGTVKDDSTVNIDYYGTVDGEARDGMTAEDQEIDIADSGMIPGFAEGIVGHKVGEEFNINVTFPDPYELDEELSGKPAVFKIRVNYLIEEQLPEYNEEYVKENTDYDTVEEYEAAVREDLEKEIKEEADDEEYGQLFQQILESSEVIEYPEEEMTSQREEMINEYKDYAESYGMEYEDFLQSMVGMDAETFESEVDTVVENSIKQELVLHALAKELGIKVTDRQYSDFLDGLLEDADYDRDSFEEESGQTIDEYAEEYHLYESYLYQLVMEKVLEKSVAKEAE